MNPHGTIASLTTMGGMWMFAQVPLPFDWGSLALQGTATGAVIFVGYHLLRMAANDRKLERRQRALQSLRYDESNLTMQACLTDCAIQGSKMNTLYEALSPLANVNPSQSTVVNIKHMTERKEKIAERLTKVQGEIRTLQLEEEKEGKEDSSPDGLK